jgi:two-component system LytT family response regulator
VPGLLLVAALLILGRVPRAAGPARAGELPLLPRQIDWVAAAGNYVELHAGGRTILHRATLGSLEEMLARHGFVRIHRSTLVRQDAIDRVRSVDMLLKDGTSLKLGKRYRASLESIRPLVPAE